jgi:hypothetical protein
MFVPDSPDRSAHAVRPGTSRLPTLRDIAHKQRPIADQARPPAWGGTEVDAPQVLLEAAQALGVGWESSISVLADAVPEAAASKNAAAASPKRGHRTNWKGVL